EDGIRYATVTGVQTCALPIFEAMYRLMTSPQARVEDILPLARPVQVPVVERPYQVLPHAEIGDLTGLVGHLDEVGGRQDLPVLRSEERRVGKEGRWRGAQVRG